VANTKRKQTLGRNFVIIGPKGGVTVVSGKSGKTTELSKSQAAGVLELIRARQQLGNDITQLLDKLGVIVGPKGTVHIPDE